MQESTVNQKAITGWCMYDWANSSFFTSAAVAIAPIYFVQLFTNSLGNSVEIFGFNITSSSTWSFGVAFSALIVAISTPFIGIIADRTKIKKKLLFYYTLIGSIVTCAAFFTNSFGSIAWVYLAICFIIGNAAAVGGTVFYNSILNHLVPKSILDSISSRGYAIGYLGGGLLLLIHLIVIQGLSALIDVDFLTRMCLASVGVWWFGWSIWTFRTVPEPEISNPINNFKIGYIFKLSITELKETLNEITLFKHIVWFLIAYLLFNDGIQTVLTIAGAYGADTLGLPLMVNIITILLIQFIAAAGSMGFNYLAKKTSTKISLTSTLVGWIIIITFAIGFAPLIPENHSDFDYQISFESGNYIIEKLPEIPDSMEELKTKYGDYELLQKITKSDASNIFKDIATNTKSSFSISIQGGALDGKSGIGPLHPSQLQHDLIVWWPTLLRNILWDPLGMTIEIQWIILGTCVGLVMGGSQALARSLFAYMIPEKRSTEFFSFFGFIGRTSAIIGPLLYAITVGFSTNRMAISILVIIILIGTILLRKVNPEEARLFSEKKSA